MWLKKPIRELLYKEKYASNASTCDCGIDEYLKSYNQMKSLITNSVIVFDKLINKPETV